MCFFFKFKNEIENHLKESHNTKNDEIIKKLITIKTINNFDTIDSKNSTSTNNQNNNVDNNNNQGKQIIFTIFAFLVNNFNLNLNPVLPFFFLNFKNIIF